MPLLDKLGKKYKVITTADGKMSKEEFYEQLTRCKIEISLEGRPEHYELMLCGTLLFVARPTIEL